jgi:hypothetical protein
MAGDCAETSSWDSALRCGVAASVKGIRTTWSHAGNYLRRLRTRVGTLDYSTGMYRLLATVSRRSTRSDDRHAC